MDNHSCASLFERSHSGNGPYLSPFSSFVDIEEDEEDEGKEDEEFDRGGDVDDGDN